MRGLLNRKPVSKLNVVLNFDDIVTALKRLGPEEREDLLENLQAATSSSYMTSVKEARAEYVAGKTRTHAEVFRNRCEKKKRG